MRSLIIGFVILLAGCNQGTNNVPYSDPALVAKVDALTKGLADATRVQAEQASELGKFKLIGKAHGVASSERVMAIGEAAVVTPNFGPCTDMGVLEGQSFASGGSPLGAITQAFKNCTGTHAEYDVDTGNLHTANRVYFTSLDCSGTPYMWQAGGQGYDSQTLNDGLAFISGVDNKAYWVKPGQTPQMTQVGSVFIITNGGCSADGDFQPMWVAAPNATTVNGVPMSVGHYSVVSP